MMSGLDYAWTKPGPTEVYRLGYRFVCRYLAPLPSGKALTPAERAMLHAAGLDIVLNWEYATDGVTGGYAAGIEHATEALRQAGACGAPSDTAIYFSADGDVRQSGMGNVRRYLDGAATVLGRSRVGVYGGYTVVSQMRSTGVASWGWQTYAWSAGKWSTMAHIRQVRNGVTVDDADCDVNAGMVDAFGQWRAPKGLVP